LGSVYETAKEKEKSRCTPKQNSFIYIFLQGNNSLNATDVDFKIVSGEGDRSGSYCYYQETGNRQIRR